MKIEFDKFNMTQKIYSVAGVVLGILVYMNDENYLNVAIGIVLLTAVVTLLLKYDAMKICINSGVLFCFLFGGYFIAKSYFPEEDNVNAIMAKLIIAVFSNPISWVVVVLLVMIIPPFLRKKWRSGKNE